MATRSGIIGAVGASSNELYQAVLALSWSIAGRTDLYALSIAESFRRIVKFDHVGLMLRNPKGITILGYILNEPGNPVIRRLPLPVEDDPARWVWLNQQPFVISHFESETRWPALRVARELGIRTLVLIPLTTGDHRLGGLGVSSVAPFDPNKGEIAFLERAASEFAVAGGAPYFMPAVRPAGARGTMAQQPWRVPADAAVAAGLLPSLSLAGLLGKARERAEESW